MNIKVIIIFLLLFSCSSSSINKSVEKKEFSTENNLIDILIKVKCSENNVYRQVKINEDLYLFINGNYCNLFKEYLDKGKTVALFVTGNLNKKSFNRESGYFVVFYEFNEKDKKVEQMKNIPFSNFGFYNDSTSMQSTIEYKIVTTDYKVNYRGNDNEFPSGKYQLKFVLDNE